MAKKPTKLIGLSFSDFKDLVKTGEELHLQTARLIPFYKHSYFHRNRISSF
ncbi:hypothetical protein KAH37_09055 [bacterium]|nr:hypothetical protein [bacterium]